MSGSKVLFVLCLFFWGSALLAQSAPSFERSVQVDPLLHNYKGRSPESIAAEVRRAGYPAVRYVLTRDSQFDPILMEAFQKQGLRVWYLTFMNGTYSTADLPAGWEAWKMVTRSDLEGHPLNDGYTRLCLNNPDYRRWKKRQMARMLRHPFVGVDMAEPHWPEYPGISNPSYACFCTHCRTAFLKRFPEEKRLPDILHPQSAEYPDKNPLLWRKWLRFRQETLTAFVNDMVNGQEGVRKSAPKAKVSVWMLGLSGKDGLQMVREDSGEDPTELVRVVRPDLFCIQTHWPDWMRPDLSPDYPKAYLPYFEAVRKVMPKVPLMVQADIGSQLQNRRDAAWIARFEQTCRALGIASTTLYEFSLNR